MDNLYSKINLITDKNKYSGLKLIVILNLEILMHAIQTGVIGFLIQRANYRAKDEKMRNKK